MKTKRQWNPGNRLDGILNVLLIVLALGVLGVGAMDIEANAAGYVAAGEERT
jgi:hypothetical protein